MPIPRQAYQTQFFNNYNYRLGQMDLQERFNFQSVEVVDISPFTQGGSNDDKQKVARSLRKICKESGFFYITGHGVSAQLSQDIQKAASTFFNLTAEEKNQIHMKKGGTAWRGYFTTGEELTSGKIDYKQGLYLGQELDESHPAVKNQTPLHGKNQFPANPPELRPLILKWMETMQRLGFKLLEAIAMSLQLDPQYFSQGICRDPLCLFRIFSYHKGPEGQESWGVGEHTDYGLLTILMFSASGLEVKNRQNKWIKADLIPNTFVINIGDMLQRMTRGLYRSTPHRVRMESNQERISFPYFFDPGWGEYIHELKIPISPDEQGLLKQQSLQQRWDNQSLTQMNGTYGDYLSTKVSLVFPDLAKDNLTKKAQK